MTWIQFVKDGVEDVLDTEKVAGWRYKNTEKDEALWVYITGGYEPISFSYETAVQMRKQLVRGTGNARLGQKLDALKKREEKAKVKK